MKAILPLFLVGLASASAAQATIRVPADVPTIQAGIDAANPGDTVLVAPGTYNENLNYLGKAITVTSEGGALVTTVDGLGLGAVVLFHSQEGPGSILDGFTITGGVASTNPGAGIGCIDLVSGLPSATPLITDSIIKDNTSLANGGGVGGSAILEDCTIMGNDAGSGCGGGVWGAATLRRCEVTGNTAQDGGGLYLLADAPGALVEDSTLAMNLAIDGARGGGIHAAPGLTGNTSIVVRRCLLIRNTSNGLVQASSRGGAVHVSAPAGISVIERCTILDNNAVASVGMDDFGGIYGPATVVDSIVRDNDANQIDTQGTVVTYSNIGGGAAGS